MAVAGEQILTRLGFEVDGISLKSSLEKVAAFGSALRRAFADASAALVGVAKGEAEVAAQADALGVSVERFAEWRFIAEQTGASADALEASLKAMLANNPGLSDAASELERAGGAMREMGDAQREAYAQGAGHRSFPHPHAHAGRFRAARHVPVALRHGGDGRRASRRGQQGLP